MKSSTIVTAFILLVCAATPRIAQAQQDSTLVVSTASIALPQKLSPVEKPLRFSLNQLTVPGGLLATGIFLNNNKPRSIKNMIAKERNEHMPDFHTRVDNYLLVAPIALAYGLDAFGVKSKTDILNRSLILLKGELMVYGSVSLLKNTTNVLRPDGSNRFSFPSGHTAQAFAAATFLSEEYKDRFKWMPYVSYGLASSVGMMRMANNKHYISDVLLGAGIGILSMKAAYWTHQYRFGKKADRAVMQY